MHAKPPITSSVIQHPSNVQQTQSDQDKAALQVALQNLHFSEQSSPQPSTHSDVIQSPSAAVTTTARAPVISVQGAQAQSQSFLQPTPGTSHLPPSPPIFGSLQADNIQTFHPPPSYSELLHDPLDSSGDPFTLPLPPSPVRQFLNSSATSTISGLHPVDQLATQQLRVVTPPVASSPPHPPPSNIVTRNTNPVKVAVNTKASPIINLTRKRKQNPNIDSKSDQERYPPPASRLELNTLNTMLQNHTFDPSNNNFSNHQIPDPNDSSKTCYSLPDYLSIYVLTL